MSEELQPSVEFLNTAEDQSTSKESWVDNVTLLTEGQHSVKILIDGTSQSRNVNVVRSLDTLEIDYVDGDYSIHHIVKPNGLTYTTRTYRGMELGIPKSVSSKGLWRFYS
jgi:hypothetical protein